MEHPPVHAMRPFIFLTPDAAGGGTTYGALTMPMGDATSGGSGTIKVTTGNGARGGSGGDISLSSVSTTDKVGGAVTLIAGTRWWWLVGNHSDCTCRWLIVGTPDGLSTGIPTAPAIFR
jgi:hypothetical protein